jgi:hypothetical protein
MLAAADVLIVAADVTGSAQLRKAADSFSRAAALIPGPPRPQLADPLTRALRTSARLMAASRPPGRYRPDAPETGGLVLLLLVALAVTAMTLAVIRLSQRREYQARKALDAALRIIVPDDDRSPSPASDRVDPAPSRRTARRPAATLGAHRRRGGISARPKRPRH